MSRILFCVVPEKGHLNPCIGPAQHLQALGHELSFYAPADICDQLSLAGNFAFLGPRHLPEQRDLSRGSYFAEKIQDAQWLHNWIRHLLLDGTPAMIDDLRRAMQQWKPDLVVIDPLLYASAIAAHQEGLPWACLSNSLNPVLPEQLDSALLRSIRQFAPERDQLFAQYGMQAQFRGCDIMSPYLTMALATAALVGAPPPGVHLVGPSLPVHQRGDETDFPWEWLDHSLALVYLSLGSQLYYHPDIFIKVAQALGDLPVQLVLSVGDLVDSPLLPPQHDRCIAVRYAPQLDLLAKAQVFINHGGANSVMEALSHGVPMLLSPLCNDQFHSAYFVQSARAGLTLDLRSATAEDIKTAVSALLADGPIRQQAAKIASSYQSNNGATAAARLISELASKNHQATGS